MSGSCPGLNWSGCCVTCVTSFPNSCMALIISPAVIARSFAGLSWKPQWSQSRRHPTVPPASIVSCLATGSACDFNLCIGVYL